MQHETWADLEHGHRAPSLHVHVHVAKLAKLAYSPPTRYSYNPLAYLCQTGLMLC